MGFGKRIIDAKSRPVGARPFQCKTGRAGL